MTQNSKKLRLSAADASPIFFLSYKTVFENHQKMSHTYLCTLYGALGFKIEIVISAMLSNAQAMLSKFQQCSAMFENAQQCSTMFNNAQQCLKMLSNV